MRKFDSGNFFKHKSIQQLIDERGVKPLESVSQLYGIWPDPPSEEETQAYCEEFSSPLDLGIAPMVQALRSIGIDTFESCEGGEGHAYLEPTVRFFGGLSDAVAGVRACEERGLKPLEIQQVWPVSELSRADSPAPYWQITFVFKPGKIREAFPDGAERSGGSG